MSPVALIRGCAAPAAGRAFGSQPINMVLRVTYLRSGSSSSWVHRLWVVPADPIGLSDMATLLGVSKMTAARYARREGFPEPIVIARGRVWSRAKVERWAAESLPLRPGRPPKA